MGLMESKNGSEKECAKRFRCPKCLLRRITVVFNEAPKYRSEEARECGSEKWKARKARKVVNAGNAEREARMSGMIAKLKNIVLNGTLNSCMMYLLRFHYSLRDREPEREAQEGAEKRNSGNLRILCHGNNRFFFGGTRKEIAGNEQTPKQVTARKTVSEICRFPLPCSVKDRIAI